MKLLHVPFCYWPDAVGGTEVYVRSLAKQQQRQGVDVLIAAPASGPEQYSHDGLRVRRFPVAQHLKDVKDMYGEGDGLASRAFDQILEEENPDLVHLHAFTRGVSLRLVRAAKNRGLPVVFSYHTPTVSCQRGTLLRWGSDVCDGVLDVKSCSRCALHGKGLNRIASVLAGSIPSGVGRLLGDIRLSGGAWTAARMTELVRVRQNMFRGLMSEVDRVIALCQWVKDVLLRNGVPEGKITVSRQGLDRHVAPGPPPPSIGGPIRLAFLGRVDSSKGIDILIHALRRVPRLALQMDIFGVVQGTGGESYAGELRAIAAPDSRITFHEPLPPETVVERLQRYHALVVPSQWLETGPRVVLEAFAAGVPVIGSDLGGISELVQHGINGLLVDPGSITGWADAIYRASVDPNLLSRLRSRIQLPRGISDVAREIAGVYAPLIHNRLRLPT